jgi:hypothetical protein
MVIKTFTLANRGWSTKWVPHAKLEDITGRSSWGGCDCERAIIYLSKRLGKMPVELTLHTLEHELEHALLFAAGVPVEDHDERLIDAKAALRRQFELTRR